jgi:hypothetical protein
MIFQIISSVLAGFGFYFLVTKIIDLVKEIKKISEERKIYHDLTRDILSKQIKFKDRINHIVRFTLPISNKKYEALLGISLKNNLVFFIKDNSIIYTLQHYNNEIIKVLQTTFHKEINTVVHINGDIVDRRTYENSLYFTLNQNELNELKSLTDPDYSLLNLSSPKLSKQEQLNLLLDKINQSGYDSLTEEEKEQLRKLSNN